MLLYQLKFPVFDSKYQSQEGLLIEIHPVILNFWLCRITLTRFNADKINNIVKVLTTMSAL